MPEGDTIFRSANALRKWLGGREVTDVASRERSLGVDRLVGSTLTSIESRGKHLLMTFEPAQLVLHTHMRMSGSWHVYPTGEKWRKPARQMVVSVTCGNRLAVCFNAPVVRLVAPHDLNLDSSLNNLGSDLLGDGGVDIDDIMRRIRAGNPRREAGNVLLDQHLLAGIGNIYRCETLYLHRCDPRTPIGTISNDVLRSFINTATVLLSHNARIGSNGSRNFGLISNETWVYGRVERPCHACGTLISCASWGDWLRLLYWCPRCQVTTGTLEPVLVSTSAIATVLRRHNRELIARD